MAGKFDIDIAFDGEDVTDEKVEEAKARPLKYFIRMSDLARAVNEWRIFPRALIIMYMWLLYTSAMWYMGLPDASGPQSAFISAVLGAGAAWFGIYSGTGNNK